MTAANFLVSRIIYPMNKESSLQSEENSFWCITTDICSRTLDQRTRETATLQATQPRATAVVAVVLTQSFRLFPMQIVIPLFFRIFIYSHL